MIEFIFMREVGATKPVKKINVDSVQKDIFKTISEFKASKLTIEQIGEHLVEKLYKNINKKMTQEEISDVYETIDEVRSRIKELNSPKHEGFINPKHEDFINPKYYPRTKEEVEVTMPYQQTEEQKIVTMPYQQTEKQRIGYIIDAVESRIFEVVTNFVIEECKLEEWINKITEIRRNSEKMTEEELNKAIYLLKQDIDLNCDEFKEIKEKLSNLTELVNDLYESNPKFREQLGSAINNCESLKIDIKDKDVGLLKAELGLEKINKYIYGLIKQIEYQDFLDSNNLENKDVKKFVEAIVKCLKKPKMTIIQSPHNSGRW